MNMTGSKPPPGETPTNNSFAEDVQLSVGEERYPQSTSETTKSKKFPVIELFGPVIQGEGSQAGQQTMFVRFGGCDYRCTKCDSMHAVEPKAVQANATYMTAVEIAEGLNLQRYVTGVKWVTFSGGNPCMHQLGELVTLLKNSGWYINVETQGTLWQEWVNDCNVVTISPKSHGMGEKYEQKKLAKFIGNLATNVPLCVKVVVFSTVDFEFALTIQEDVRLLVGPSCMVVFYLSLGNPYPPVLNEDTFKLEDDFAPVGGLSTYLLKNYRELSEEVLMDPRLKDFRFLPQIHVLTYGNESER